VSTSQTPGGVAPANEEAVRAWDTVLYERWKTNRRVFVGALDEATEALLERYPVPEGGRVIDCGCGFGESARTISERVGPSGRVRAVDSSPHFIADAREELSDLANVDFEVADVQTAQWDPEFDYAFSRMGTQFFSGPVPAMRAMRASLVPGGRMAKIVWRRKAESEFWAETENIVLRYLSRPETYEADTCGPGPFSMGNPDTVEGILKAAGFADIELTQLDFDYYMGADIDEAIEALTAIGPGAELIRLNAEHGERRRPEIEEALAERYSDWQREDGSIVGRGSVWLVGALNPGD
jgi:ubiquinone/menaquinone biosynthesis C-methylase UbiE